MSNRHDSLARGAIIGYRITIFLISVATLFASIAAFGNAHNAAYSAFQTRLHTLAIACAVNPELLDHEGNRFCGQIEPREH